MEDLVSRKKDRSPNFPFISLEAALDRARAFYEEERRGAAPVARVAKHWRYSPSSSGLLQTIAALKSYGLMADEGSGSERRLRLTEIALRILLDTRADSLERAELIKRAALNPSVSSDIHSNWPDGLPSEDTLSHALIFEMGFAPPNASRAVRILKENQRFASILSGDRLSPSEMSDQDGVGESVSEVQVQTVDRAPSDYPRLPLSHPTSVGAKSLGGVVPLEARTHGAGLALPFTEQVLDPDGRAMRIEFSAPPTEEMYEFLKDYIDLRLKAIRRKAATML
ncbi:hypothetical protein [Ralstonia mojiangensis]|uniref:hypothetical protein n=1 Tax=Ralstonia mojiangensis TaxID=2953895 RepID=UPI002091C874|nr:hypothetical protein [Ralstonia mojiangensis]MCO5412137.1 hypothetical protein [Ralstonia mojiangensis]